jgi:hypothetical protein
MSGVAMRVMDMLLESEEANQSVCYYLKKNAGFHGARLLFR